MCVAAGGIFNVQQLPTSASLRQFYIWDTHTPLESIASIIGHQGLNQSFYSQFPKKITLDILTSDERF